MNIMTNAGSKIVYEIGEITVAGQTKSHSEIISNVLSLNEMTKKYRVTFDSGDENGFKVHIGDKIVKFPANDDGIYLSKLDNMFLGYWPNRKKGILLKD